MSRLISFVTGLIMAVCVSVLSFTAHAQQPLFATAKVDGTDGVYTFPRIKTRCRCLSSRPPA